MTAKAGHTASLLGHCLRRILCYSGVDVWRKTCAFCTLAPLLRLSSLARSLRATPSATFCRRLSARPLSSSRIIMGAGPELQSGSEKKQYGGWNKQYQHRSDTLGCDMKFSVFTPPASESKKVPVLYFLSGLTCDDQTFIVKSNAQRKAAEHGIALVVCDTSPRGLNIDGEEDDWDFGTGAGFYLNATQPKWKQYRMYDYVVKELPQAIQSLPGLDVSKASICGHSMGGHGALTIFLKNSDAYKSVSAFAPICNPINVQWGQKAFSGYLGDDQSTWKEYDATELVKQYKGPNVPILIDIGSKDNFKDKQLEPEAFQKAAEGKLSVNYRLQDGYDHSYFTISTFIDDHMNHHAKALCKM